jgi:tetratricopeptide (TPR) repeat protein
MRHRGGRNEDALADFAQAQRLARTAGDDARAIEILLDHATALDWLNQLEGAQALVTQAWWLSALVDDALLAARLLMARGRHLWRNNRLADAWPLLEEAVARARTLGVAAHEAHVASLLMLGHLLPALGQLTRAAEVFAEAIALCEARRDPVHLAGALNNRMSLWAARNDARAAEVDQRRFMQLMSELGMSASEQHGRFNLALIAYQRGDFAGARARIATALAHEARLPTDAVFLLALRLLDARCRLFVEGVAVAPAVAALRAARAEMLPFLRVQLAILEAGLADTSDEVWQALAAECTTLSLSDEQVELLEVRALVALRGRRPDEACRWLRQALALTARCPTFAAARIERALTQLERQRRRSTRPVVNARS